MAKVFTFIVFLAGLTTLLSLFGIPTGAGVLLSSVGFIDAPQNIQGSSFFTTIAAIFSSLAVVSIVVGLIRPQAFESFLIVTLASTLLAFASDFASVYSYVANTYPTSWVRYVLAPIFVAIIVGYGVAIVDWWRGSDG